MSTKLYLCSLLCVFVWMVPNIESFEEFCDEPFPTLYCTCEVDYYQTLIACYITGNMTKNDPIWKKMMTVENIYTVKLLIREPAWFDEIPIDSLKFMPYLENVKVQQANLGELKSHAVSNLTLLRELELDDCGITGLQEHAISNMPKLKKLSMTDNLIQEILDESLTGLMELEQLFLERNRISRIEPCAFCDLQNLKELDLWLNEITDLTDYMFRGLRYLKRLDLSRNKISILNEKVFHSMPKLHELELNGNMIHYVNPRAFQGLDKLMRISLHSNRIKTLPNIVFKNLKNLRTVDLHDNQLETFQVQILKHMDNVGKPHFSLDIGKNPLICDCRLSWVKEYMKYKENGFFVTVLKQLQCQDVEKENVTHTVHSLRMNCTESADHHPKKMSPTPRAIFIDLVPHEIQKLKNKTMFTEDVTVDNAVISQDSEVDIAENIEVDVGSSSSDSNNTISINFHLLVFTTLLTVFLVRKRKGTCTLLY